MAKERYYVFTFVQYESTNVEWFYKLENAIKYFNKAKSWSTPILIKGTVLKGNLKYI